MVSPLEVLDFDKVEEKLIAENREEIESKDPEEIFSEQVKSDKEIDVPKEELIQSPE